MSRCGDDMLGMRFGRLLVLSVDTDGCGRKHRLATVRCDCGTEKRVSVFRLRNGETKSCGCLHRERQGARVRTHGMTDSPTHQSWRGMAERCTLTTHRSYADYGGRGIRICERWLGDEGFANFLADMGPRPSRRHQIDRNDNDGNYEPGNCRWSTVKEQSNNRRGNILLTLNGVTKTLQQWSDETGLYRETIKQRLRRGWPIERALQANRRSVPGVTRGET